MLTWTRWARIEGIDNLIDIHYDKEEANCMNEIDGEDYAVMKVEIRVL